MYLQKTTLTPKTLFEESQQMGLKYVLKLNPDKLLSPCYTALGKQPKSSTYGGWESRQIQGHSLGHYLSALSGFYYQTKNDEAKKKLDYTIKCINERTSTQAFEVSFVLLGIFRTYLSSDASVGVCDQIF